MRQLLSLVHTGDYSRRSWRLYVNYTIVVGNGESPVYQASVELNRQR